MRGGREWRRFCGSRLLNLKESSACQGAFASRLAPTFDCILTGEMQSTVGASLLAKRSVAFTLDPARTPEFPPHPEPQHARLSRAPPALLHRAETPVC
ncbi:hypothetical protein EVS84_02585 [Pseudomonas koreensis]|uniref:Uncharacterized protein n=1 Tax=Pseudomonas koreensis TaxID=198620 RepID=A0A4V1WIC1_9PSED|nr:hypothetical protein EVS84_02585 [Pseudomonas koreensis]